jgi:MFS family permease
LILTNVLGGASSLVLGILVVTESVLLWQVFVLAGVLGLSNAIDGPVRQSFTSEIVGPEDLANAVSLNSANFNAGRLIGPAVSGGLIAAFGTGPSFLINALSYLFVIAALIKLNEKTFFREDQEKSDGNIREGIKYVKSRPDIYVVLLIVLFVSTFGLNFQIFNALMATKEFGLGPASFGLMGTFVAIGSLTGAIGSARLERFRSTKFVIKGGIVFSTSVIILSVLPTFTVYMIWLPICGLSALTTLVSANSLVQTSSDTAIRGRVMGLYLLVFMGGAPFGSPLIGVTTELIGIRPTITICGTISLVASILVWFIYKNRVTPPADISVAAVLKSVNRN